MEWVTRRMREEGKFRRSRARAAVAVSLLPVPGGPTIKESPGFRADRRAATWVGVKGMVAAVLVVVVVVVVPRGV